MSVAVDAEVRVYDRDLSLVATFAGLDLSWSHGKGVDGSSCGFTVSGAEDDYATTVLDDCLAIVRIDAGSGMQSVATPYLLTASADVLADGAPSLSAAGQGALMLSNEWLVLHDEGVVNRRGPQTVYFGWQHPEFDDSGWDEPNHYDRDPAPTTPRENQPSRWECAAADWLQMDGEGGLTLFRLGSFTISDDPQKVRIAATADEEFKVYLFGPGFGGVIIDESEQETGYTYSRRYNEVLEPGTYFLAAEMTTVFTPGGDGLDALAFYCGPVDNDDNVTTFHLHSGASGITALRQGKETQRPGLTVGHIVRLLMEQNETWQGTCSTSMLTRTFDDSDDSDGSAWGDVHERSWQVGTTVAQVLSDLGDLADFDVTPSFDLDAYGQRGSDLSASVALVKGSTAQAADENLEAYTVQTRAPTATRALILTPDGFTTKVDDTKEAARMPRAIYLESQQASSAGEAKRLAQRVITASGVTRASFTARFVAISGAIPGIDFGWGDTIAALGRGAGAKDVTVLSWQGSRDNEAGVLMFEAEVE